MGAPQGSCLAGIFFNISLSSLAWRLENSPILRPLSRGFCSPNTGDPVFLCFNKTAGFSDDLDILTRVSFNSDNTSPELDEIEHLFEQFNQLTNLKLSDEKGICFSYSISDTTNKVINHYNYDYKTHFRHLGAHLNAHSTSDSQPIISHLERKVKNIASSFPNGTNFIGRSALANTFILPCIQFSLYSLNSTSVKALAPIQKQLNWVTPLNSHINNTSYLPSDKGGLNCINIYSKWISTRTYFIQKLFFSKLPHYQKLRSFLQEALGIELTTIIKTGPRFQQLVYRYLDYLGLARWSRALKVLLSVEKSSHFNFLFGSSNDRSLPLHPKSYKSFRIRPAEFSPRIPALSSLSLFSSVEQILTTNKNEAFTEGEPLSPGCHLLHPRIIAHYTGTLLSNDTMNTITKHIKTTFKPLLDRVCNAITLEDDLVTPNLQHERPIMCAPASNSKCLSKIVYRSSLLSRFSRKYNKLVRKHADTETLFDPASITLGLHSILRSQAPSNPASLALKVTLHTIFTERQTAKMQRIDCIPCPYCSIDQDAYHRTYVCVLVLQTLSRKQRMMTHKFNPWFYFI